MNVVSGGTLAPTTALSITSPGTATIDTGAGTMSLSGITSGNGTLTKNGAGTLSLTNAANTFTGSLTIPNGTLSVSSIGSGSGKVITLGNTTTSGVYAYAGTGASFSDARTLSIGSHGGTVRVTNAGTNLSFTNPVNVSGGSFTKDAPAL